MQIRICKTVTNRYNADTEKKKKKENLNGMDNTLHLMQFYICDHCAPAIWRQTKETL
jgi:hypothetical protein